MKHLSGEDYKDMNFPIGLVKKIEQRISEDAYPEASPHVYDVESSDDDS